MGSVYLENFPGTLDPCRTAFDVAGEAVGDAVCIYMTNRYDGRWSYLLPKDFERTFDPLAQIPMGYTQLWILQPLLVVCAPTGARRRIPDYDRFDRFPKDIDRDEYLKLFHVFREPGGAPSDHVDHVGFRRTYLPAVKLAKEYARAAQRRTLVARLLHDWQWH